MTSHGKFDESAHFGRRDGRCLDCLLYTSDAADDLLCVDLGGRGHRGHVTDDVTWKI